MRTTLYSMTFVLLASTWTWGQADLPEAVTRYISSDTLVVTHLDLKALAASPNGLSFSGMLTPVQPLAHLAGSVEQALDALKKTSAKEVYFLLSTTEFPADGVLVVPTSEPQAISDALKSVWPEHVEQMGGAVVAGSAEARLRLRNTKSATRPEFSKAMQGVRNNSIRIALVPSQDARRVIREFLPVLPEQFGGAALGKTVDDTAWIAVGLSVPPRMEINLIAQGSNPESAETLRGILEKLVTMALQSDVAKQVIPKANELLPLFIPKRDGDRVTLALNEENGGAKRLATDVIPPLLELTQSNARQSVAITNMKQIAIALHNFHDVHKAFPAAATSSKDGKQKLLSWRVMILPYLSQRELYDQFHLDEAWDSAHNKALIAKMPAIFESSNVTPLQVKQGMTTFLVPVGPKTAFGQSKGVRIRDIIDGTSNTIMFVDAVSERAAIWTKPDDLPFDADKPWLGLEQNGVKQFWAALCDGSARRFGDSTTVANLRRYFQMNDGEVIDE